MPLPHIVSLFSGAGGLDLGFKQAGFPLSFAVDISESAIETHRRNFPEAAAVAADLEVLGPDGVLQNLLELIPLGQSVGVIGGPPCQGFSRANTASDPEDPRNRLPFLYLEIVQELQRHYVVEFVLFENVLGIRDAKHLKTFEGIIKQFEHIGLAPHVKAYSALDFGVPQARNRVIISGFRDERVAANFSPQTSTSADLSVRSAIGHLPEPAYFSHRLNKSEIPHHENHWTMAPKSKRFTDPEAFDAPARSFRRLSWDKPSPTVAYGHREIHVHPEGHRRLSLYEALILQGFPRDFVLEGNLSAQVQQVSNAVPPPLAKALAEAIAASLTQSDVALPISERPVETV